VIVLAVRWYLRYGLSSRDVEQLLAERGLTVDHVTIYRWVQRFTPELIDAARPSRHVGGDRWFVDETYLKLAGRWVYLYRAIDQHGQVIDVLASPKRDLAATCPRHLNRASIGRSLLPPPQRNSARQRLAGAGIATVKIPPQCPRANCFAERFVLTSRTKLTDRILIFGERRLRTVLARYVTHYIGWRPHRALQLRPPRPEHPAPDPDHQQIRRRSVLGGLVSEYERAA
jgi:hypothetical protein